MFENPFFVLRNNLKNCPTQGIRSSNLLWEAMPHEVPVQVTDPLDVYCNHAAADRELSVVATRRRHHVA